MEYGLIGKSISHSFSAQIHPKLFDCDYSLCELSENELDLFFKNRDFKGINVTIPYKTEVIKYLDFVDENAEKIGAVNTVVNKDGKLNGYNTDYSGLKKLISLNNVSLKGKNVLIFGNGGTSKTARAVAEEAGASEIVLVSRRKTEFNDVYENISDYYDFAEIIINTTPCGMYPNIYDCAASLDGFKRLQAVFDVVYNPLRTKLVIDAKNKGIISDGGTKMLVFQAVFAARLFSGLQIPDEAGFEIINRLTREKENIVLIGMPASGKTTAGKILSKKLGRDFVDTDSEIEKKHNMSPKDIINSLGEEVFRDYETDVIREISARQGIVIATGGGAVERQINIDLLKENGKIVFLDRPLSFLSSDSGRPLSSTKEKLAELYKRRLPLYEKYADLKVRGSEDQLQTANSIEEVI